MVKGGKRYSSMSNDGKWFAHQDFSEETRTRELCTSTGMMLSQIKTSLSQTLNTEHYPKLKTEQKTRAFPYSDHDNKHSLEDNICVFSQGVGRKKCLDDRRQHISHFCLCYGRSGSTTEETAGNLTSYQSDFKVMQAVDVPASTRRFPRNHRWKSAQAALAQAGEQFMWFGRHDSEPSK